MSEAPTVDLPVNAEPKLPPTPPVPSALVRAAYLVSRRSITDWLTRRYGRCYALRVPVFGNAVIISDPALTKQVFTTSPDVLYNIQPNLSRLLGPGSVFALDGAAHRDLLDSFGGHVGEAMSCAQAWRRACSR